MILTSKIDKTKRNSETGHLKQQRSVFKLIGQSVLITERVEKEEEKSVLESWMMQLNTCKSGH